MARIKGGLNKFLRRQKTEKASVQTALDRKNQCSCKNERFILQQTDARP